MSGNHEAEQRVIGELLKGGCYLFGKRVTLAWPDGPPSGMDAERLKDIGEAMSPSLDRAQWIPVEARCCEVTITCARILEDGRCSLVHPCLVGS